jgi:hypothetical protein
MLPVEIAAFPLEPFFLATSGSPELCQSPSISRFIPPPVITQQIVSMVCACSV